MVQAGRDKATLSRRDAMACVVTGVALPAVSGCERRGGDMPFQSIDTQCPDVCPTALSRAAAVMQKLGS